MCNIMRACPPLHKLSPQITKGHSRSLSGIDLSGLSSRFLDVVRSGSLNPENPVLNSLKAEGGVRPPEFKRMLPYHLENAIQSTRTQYGVDLAELEVSIAAGVDKELKWDTMLDLLNRIDEIEAPIYQVDEVGRLFTELAALPDQQIQWKQVYRKARAVRGNLRPFTESKIIYQTLNEMANSSMDDFPLHMRLAFEKHGLLTDDSDEERAKQLREIYEKLRSLNVQLESIVERSGVKKADRLNIVKCIYNIIGLSHLQAQHLGYSTVSSMMLHTRNSMASSVEEIVEKNESLAEILRPHVPKATVTLDEEAGAFLPSSKPKLPSDSEKELWVAKQSFKKLVYLDGVIQALVDFCDSIFCLTIVENIENVSTAGWNQNVRVFDVFDKTGGSRIGTILFDPYDDKYWRSGEARGGAMSRLFSVRTSQTSCPVAVIGLSIDPTWDDAPTPLSWKDYQDVMFHFGNALQKLLGQKAKLDNNTPYYMQPSDVSDFLGTFMLLWLYNDGFLQRVAQLSQDQFTFQPELMRALREDFKKRKAINLTENIFISMLELMIFTNFDPMGDETIVSLQDRVAQKYIPFDMPSSNDLSPMIEIVQVKALDPKVSTHSPIWSEMLACMVYRKLVTTDLNDTEAVGKLGLGIRNLFLSPDTSSKEHFESLCEEKISLESLKDLHRV